MPTSTKNRPRERYGEYEIIRAINTRRPGAIPVLLLAAVEADNPMRYQVRRLSTTVQFATYREAQDYCRERGWA